MTTNKLLVAVAAAALLPLSAQADLVYSVNRLIGGVGGGTVKGTITTNGKIGALNLAADFVAWQLELDVSGTSGPVTITNANSAVTPIGTAVLADEDSIDFDFGAATTSYLLFASNSTPFDRWCLQTTNCFTFTGPSEFVGSLNNVGTPVGDSETRGGRVSFATLAVNPVPEPASLLLASLGLLGLGLTRRRA